MNTFCYLLLAHLILDYPLQGEFLGVGKSKYTFLLLVHCLMWALGCAAVLEWMGLYAPWKLQWLFWGHLAMDYLKCRGYLKTWCVGMWGISIADFKTPVDVPDWVSDNLGLSLWVDQSFHIFQLWVCLGSWGS